MYKLSITALALACVLGTALAAQEINRATFNEDGSVQAPKPEEFRRWIFIGTPLTPNGLNDGAAAFQEFHNVYIEPSAPNHLNWGIVFYGGF